jgi:hypothetical protein
VVGGLRGGGALSWSVVALVSDSSVDDDLEPQSKN